MKTKVKRKERIPLSPEDDSFLLEVL